MPISTSLLRSLSPASHNTTLPASSSASPLCRHALPPISPLHRSPPCAPHPSIYHLQHPAPPLTVVCISLIHSSSYASRPFAHACISLLTHQHHPLVLILIKAPALALV
eukprot:1417504-Rhodomonas_salina.1